MTRSLRICFKTSFWKWRQVASLGCNNLQLCCSHSCDSYACAVCRFHFETAKVLGLFSELARSSQDVACCPRAIKRCTVQAKSTQTQSILPVRLQRKVRLEEYMQDSIHRTSTVLVYLLLARWTGPTLTSLLAQVGCVLF